MRATYKAGHPLNKLGKKNPQAPPLHLHFQQSETLTVLSGKVGLTLYWEAKDTFHTAETTGVDTPFEITPWMPHAFFPCGDAEEDTVILVWAHPSDNDMDDQMDHLFFQSLFGYVSDVHDKKEKMSILQIMLMQHRTATALVMFPRAWFLGPLRWWIPWKLQDMCATIAIWTGKKALIEKYMSPQEWDDVQERLGGKKSV